LWPICFRTALKTIGKAIEAGEIPVYVERFGRTQDEIFVTAHALRHELGAETYNQIPTGAIGLYTYYERLAQGMRQLMAGCRKFTLQHVSHLAALTRDAAEISGLPYVTEVDAAEVDKLLDGQHSRDPHSAKPKGLMAPQPWLATGLPDGAGPNIGSA
jgi:broad specificity phosphatase PhoE